MSVDDLMDEVRNAIGLGSPNDVLLDPERHEKDLENRAPSLARILRKTSVRSIVKQQALAAAPAKESQLMFKRRSRQAAWFVVLSASASAAIMVVGSVFPETDPQSVLRQALSIIFAIVGLAAAAGAATLFSIIKGNKLLEKWMANRATAETKRLEYFAKVTSSPASEGEDPARTRLEQLEYFRRYQLEGQLRYYKSASERHESAASRAATRSAIAISVAGFVNVAAGMLGAWRAELAAIAALGVVAQSVGSKITNDEAISQDGRNAERYHRTFGALIELEGRLDDVRHSIANGNERTLPAFVEVVHEQLSLEHRQWIAGREQVDAAMTRLREQLDTAKQSLAGDKAEGDTVPVVGPSGG